VAANNAQAAQQNQTASIQAGQASATQAGLQAAQQTAMVGASLASEGVDINSGSAAKVIQATSQKGELSELNVMHNALLQAYGYGTQATNYSAQSGLYGAQASQATTSAGLQSTAGLLGNANAISGASTLGQGIYNGVSNATNPQYGPLTSSGNAAAV
jgi:hypothetical protein